MGKYIDFGGYNKFYKYIWYFILLKLISNYCLGDLFQERIPILDKNAFPKNILISEAFNYLGISIISFFLVLYEYKSTKSIKDEELLKKEKSKNDIVYIYNDEESSKISIRSLIVIIILLFIAIQLKNTFFVLSLNGLDYWIFEIIFVCYLNYKLFKIPAYKHKKFSIILIIIFCTITKTLSLIYRLKDGKKPKLYNDYSWIIFAGIIFFILVTFLRSYCFCKIKWMMDIKFYSALNFMVCYGLVGSVICFSFSILSNEIPCVDENTFKDIYLICTVNKTENNNIIYYYDNYSVFFSSFGNALYVVLYIIQIITSFGVNLFAILIIKFLSPECYICSNGLYYFIVGLIDTCIFLFKGLKNRDFDFQAYNYFEMLADFFHFIGSIIYLELIELKFFGLDYYLKKNIDIRSRKDVIREYSLNGVNDNDNDNDNDDAIN